MFLTIAIDAFRGSSVIISVLALLAIAYGAIRRAFTPAWLGLVVLVLLLGDAALQIRHERNQPEEVIADPDSACVSEGTTKFCHELRHTRTSRTMIPQGWGSSGPPVVTIGFDFEGQRSCRTAKGEVVVDFDLDMHGISEPVVADYPDLMAQILPSPAELERYRIGRLVFISVSPPASLKPAILSSAFGFNGRRLPTLENYTMIKYVSVAESLAACLALGEGDG